MYTKRRARIIHYILSFMSAKRRRRCHATFSASIVGTSPVFYVPQSGRRYFLLLTKKKYACLLYIIFYIIEIQWRYVVQKAKGWVRQQIIQKIQQTRGISYTFYIIQYLQ